MLLTTPSMLRRTAAVSLIAGVAVFASADFKIVSHVTMKMDMGPMQNHEQTTTSYFKGGKMRVESSDGTTFIFDSKAKKSYMLRPTKKEYSEFSMDNMSQMNPMMKKMKMSVTAHLKPSPKRSIIAGKAANLYLVDMTIDMTMPGMSETGPSLGTMHGDMHMDQWTTMAMKDKLSAKDMAASMGQMLNGLTSMGADTSKMMKEFAKLKGVPLDSDMTMKIKLNMSKSAPSSPNIPTSFTMTMQSKVQSITEAPLNGSLFNIPAGYTKVKGGMPGRRGMGSQ